METKPTELEGYHLLGINTFLARLSIWVWKHILCLI